MREWMKTLRVRRGQSFMEWIVLFVVIILVIMAAVSGVIAPGLQNRYKDAGGVLDKTGTRLNNAYNY